LTNAAVKKLKRLFYNSFKGKSNQDLDNEDQSTDQSTDHSTGHLDRGDIKPMIVCHSDIFDVQLAEKWRYLVANNDASTQGIKEFYEKSFGFPKAVRIDPLEFYQKSEDNMLDERKKELTLAYEVIQRTTTTFILVSDSGYKIQTLMNVPATFLKKDQEEIAQVSIEINIRIWDKCRYPYEPPLFYVLSDDLNPVQLLNLSFGIQEAAEFEWYGTPMIQKVIDWINGEAAVKKLGDAPSNYSLPAAYDMLEMLKGTMELNISVDQQFSNSYDNMNIDIESSTQLYDKFLQKMDTQPYKNISKVVETLPVFQIRELLIQTIQDNSLVIICGETGIQSYIKKFRLW
jgi:hypothetical protein